MRLIFAGSPAVAIPALDRLAVEHTIDAVLTREDALLGRKRVMTPSAVAARASELKLRTVKANRLNDATVAELNPSSADVGVIVAFGALLREPVLSAPRLGWINLHFSLLPRWRGAAPVQRSLIAGDDTTGVSIFRLVSELDAGPVFAQREYRVGAHQTAGDLLQELSWQGAELLSRVVADLASGTATAVDQVGEPSFAPKMILDDARLRLTESGDDVYNRFRGVTPEPGAFVLHGGERFKILECEPARDFAPLQPGHLETRSGRVLLGTGTFPLTLERVQPPGKRAMSASDWWRGQRETDGFRFDL